MSPDLKQTLAGAIRGSSAALDLRAWDPQVICAVAEAEGVTSLLHETLISLPGFRPALVKLLEERTRILATIELVTAAALREALDALQVSGVGALLMKGAQLAYSHYPRPDLRPRLDSDILVHPGSKERAIQVVLGLGYEEIEAQQDGDLLMYQRVLSRRLPVPHTVDLHWRALNPQVFADTFAYEELDPHAATLTGLGPSARGLSPVHALALACTHRIAHHSGVTPLVWVYDIHLLASSFDDRSWQHFVSTAERYGLGRVYREGLQLAVQTFGTEIPNWVLHDERLNSRPNRLRSAYLTPRKRAATVLADLRALTQWRDRGRLISQYLFPPRTYMRNVYGRGGRTPLLLLYLVRAVRGAGK